MLFRKVCANISTTLLKQLRQETGSPINDCKKALESSGGDFAKALHWLREKGLAQADKKSSNETRQGVIVSFTDRRVAAIAEINCETDFVARTEEFISFSEQFIRNLVAQGREYSLAELDPELSLDSKRKQLIAQLQENIVISKLHVLVAPKNGVVGCYQHNRLKGSICGLGGSVVELVSDSALSEVGAQVMREASDNLAVSYLGFKPAYITPEEVEPSVVDRLREEIKAENVSKTPKQQEFILKGKLQKYYEENVFENMEYILDEKGVSVREYLKQDVESVTKGKVKIGRCLYLVI